VYNNIGRTVELAKMDILNRKVSFLFKGVSLYTPCVLELRPFALLMICLLIYKKKKLNRKAIERMILNKGKQTDNYMWSTLIS
jgi:hypothetical protein